MPSRTLPSPLASASRVDDIEDRLVAAIAIGEYLPGSRLPTERELATALGAGRMTVRAALARVLDRGLIHTRRGRGGGSFVLDQWPPSSTDAVRRTLTARWAGLTDTLQAISRLHGTVSRAAAENRTEAQAAELRTVLDGFRAAESGLAAQRADEALHLAIIDAGGNATLKEVLLELESRVSIGAPSHLWGQPEMREQMESRALAEHEALIAAIVDRRPDDAERIARHHVEIDLELLIAARERAGADAV